MENDDRPRLPDVVAVPDAPRPGRCRQAAVSGRHVRARCVLLKLEEVTGGLQLTEQYTVEIDGEPKSACVAEAIMQAYF